MRYKVERVVQGKYISYQIQDKRTGRVVKEYDSYNYQKPMRVARAACAWMNGLLNFLGRDRIETIEEAENYGASSRWVVST